MKKSLLFSITVMLAGCADHILTNQEEKAFSGEIQPMEPLAASELGQVAIIANSLSAAYYEAARKSQRVQDVASAAIILTAASAVAGAATGASDRAIANRGLAAVGIQQGASRGVSEKTIKSLFDGAQILNCIGVVATIYQNDNVLKSDPKAAQVAIGVIREVRINSRRGLTREVANYSTVITAFETVIKDQGGNDVLPARTVTPRKPEDATPTQLETFLTRLSGCTKSKNVSESNGPKQ